jgi:hypothetical protein
MDKSPQKYGIQVCMDGRNRLLIISGMKGGLWTINLEYIHLNPENDSFVMAQVMKTYIEYYDSKRFHQGFDYKILCTIVLKKTCINIIFL